MPVRWYSYDSVAAQYDRNAVPLMFTQPAQDLAGLLEAQATSRVLDVGAGSGAACIAVRMRADPAALVVALDASAAMLRIAKEKGVRRSVRGVAPGLPFRDASFDRVLGNFVINHIPDYGAALSDMVRVLGPKGRLGVTAWGAGEGEARALWSDLAAEAVGKELMDRHLREGSPSEEWFSDPQRLLEALESAGLVDVRIEERVYQPTATISDYLAAREVSLPARVIQLMRGADGWERFRRNTEEVFRARFREPIVDVRRVYFGLGVKPAF
jgi:ubiquinone/menaquinone biosynthesis C-methylase UbiE